MHAGRRLLYCCRSTHKDLGGVEGERGGGGEPDTQQHTQARYSLDGRRLPVSNSEPRFNVLVLVSGTDGGFLRGYPPSCTTGSWVGPGRVALLGPEGLIFFRACQMDSSEDKASAQICSSFG
ncbi:hypothetical protein EYF80_009845 [Liparis tanakae]|uniref:Uncharacterized protein n=1 Tax=Liparis tanakae TaxID=230148 RepID=A0A4Z2IQ46_9TELE|nr:hypothetical protein EYF80_009845 [Liparis tanakae]